MKARRAAVLALLTALAVEALWAWPWSRDMVVQPIVRPLLIMLRAAPGAVAMGSEAPMARAVAERELRNLLTPTSENLEAGKKLFGVYCTPCHGITGRGDGPVAGGALQPTDLTSRLAQQRSDGYLYATIRNGGVGMPQYHEALSPRERWQVVMFVRTLARK